LNKRVYLILMTVSLVAMVMASCVPITSVPAPVPPTAAPAEATAVATPPPAAEALATPAAAAPEVPATPDTRPAVPAPPADKSRPLAKLSTAERSNRFSGPAPTSTISDTIYVATIKTSKGDIVAELYQDTPESVNNFVTLAEDGYYDGLTFHRVEPNFVIQGGDPVGDGSGGPGYTIPAEIKHNHPRGALAWARTSDQVNPERRSSGSQFYITLDATPFLDGAYTSFGYVVDGMDIADKIAVGDKINSIEISQTAASRLPAPTPTAEPKAPTQQSGRPLAELPAAQREKAFNKPPATVIDPSKTYQATVKSEKGDIVIDLDAKGAPVTVNNFVLLSNLGFFDDMPVAYVQPESYVVMGSPANRPDSDVGYTLDPEVSPSGSKILTGTVSMYPVFNQTDNSVKASGSQFFISFALAPENQTPLSTFGTVSSGLDIASKLTLSDTVKSIIITEK
jgi:peptidyl-prolyl cis-trans isomerase B (cyclophilin B)